MFSDRLNDILFHLLPAQPEALVNVGAFADIDSNTRKEIQMAAEKALSQPIPRISLSAYLRSGDEIASLRRTRREMLLSLILGSVCTGASRYIEKMLDLAFSVTEESTWRDARRISEIARGDADLHALETACLISWMLQLTGRDIKRISEDAYLYFSDVLAKRIFIPFAARETPRWALKRDADRLSRLTSLLTSLLLADDNDRRRWVSVRRCLSLIEEAVRQLPKDGAHPYGLEAWQIDAQAVSDAATMLLLATGGEVDVRSDRKLKRMAEYPVSAHMGNGFFVNPDGTAKPDLDGETLFRIGECADNGYLKRLGAAIGKSVSPARRFSPSAEILSVLMRRALNAEPAVFPIRKNVLLPYSQLTACEASGFRACLTGGARTSGHMDAGNLHLYYQGEPIFADLDTASFQSVDHSLPTVDGYEITKGFSGAKDIDAQFEEAFTYLSINIAPGFDERAGVLSWQRTVMLSPMEKRIRIIEAFDLNHKAENVTFRFITPIRPVPNGAGEFILGNVRLSWEGNLTGKVDKVRNGYRISVTAEDIGMRGNYAFIVSA
ncbi:MAG: hypothetical protein IJC48_02875 [Clostridia bacterium]|nr:hypothetical protein [Clostridia bacterium]